MKGDEEQMAHKVKGAKGKIILLRAHQLNTFYGPPGDKLCTEVVIRLDTVPKLAFGIPLMPSEHLPSREAMYRLALEAFKNRWTVRIDYWETGKNNHVMFRIWVEESGL